MAKTAWRIGLVAVALVAVLVPVLAIQRDGPEPIAATPAKPAELPATSIVRGPDRAAARTLAVSVLSYVPARAGTITAVVRLENTRLGTVRVLGRFGLFPDAPFTAEKPADAQRFGLSLGDGDLPLLDDPDTKVVIALEPSVATGAGARMVFGGLELPR